MLEAPAGIRDISDYKFVTGQIFALKRVTESYFDEVNDDLNKEK